MQSLVKLAMVLWTERVSPGRGQTACRTVAHIQAHGVSQSSCGLPALSGFTRTRMRKLASRFKIVSGRTEKPSIAAVANGDNEQMSVSKFLLHLVTLLPAEVFSKVW